MMTPEEQADYLARCRQSGADDESAEEFLCRELERRAAERAAEWLASIVAAAKGEGRGARQPGAA